MLHAVLIFNFTCSADATDARLQYAGLNWFRKPWLTLPSNVTCVDMEEVMYRFLWSLDAPAGPTWNLTRLKAPFYTLACSDPTRRNPMCE